MKNWLRAIWSDFLRPLIHRPARFQVAALCWREGADGLEVLVITSLETRRWLLPKGWPMDGQDAPGAARIEAWEEAGVEPAHVERRSIGTYLYDKRLRGGVPVECETKVFPVEVAHLADDYPQKDQRERRWVSPEEAARMVDEPGLRDILTGFDPGRAPA